MAALESLARQLTLAWRRAQPVERICYAAGALLLSSGVAHVVVLLLSGGSWQGPLSLRKPATFGLSFGLTLITIVWVSQFVRLSGRARSLLLSAFAVASILETGLVTLQAWRGVPSHFNVATTLDAWVTRGLAGGGLLLVVMVLTLTVAAFRTNARVPASLMLAIRVGFLALTASMVVGGAMIARGMTLVFGGDPQTAYSTGGGFKPMHAVTMHAVLILPALAWLLTRTGWSESLQFRVVAAAAAIYTLLAAGVAAANLSGAL
jgi:hypothetical protein